MTEFDSHRRLLRHRLPARPLLAPLIAGLLGLAMVMPASAAVPGASLVLVDGGFTKPVLVTNAGDGSGRLFIVEKAGIIKIV